MTLPLEQPLPGVWWLHGTRGANVYLVRTAAGGVVLVDTGFADSASAILAALDAVGLPLRATLLTHRHRDHTGAAAAVAAATGAPVIAGAGDCRLRRGQLVLRSGIGRTHPVRLAAALMRRRPAPVPIAVAVAEPQEVAPGILAIPTPGHTPGSLCFIAHEQQAAFVGDLVISHDGELTRSLRWANSDDRQYLASIAAFAAVAPPAGFPGHGQPLLTGFDAALRELALLPRRPLTPRTALERAVRLARFTAGFATRRRPQAR